MKTFILVTAIALLTACAGNTRPLSHDQQVARAQRSCFDNAQQHANDNGMPSTMMLMGCPRSR